MSTHNIPVGFHFSPSDEALLMSYLRRMALGQPLPWNGIVERQLYGNENPWDLFTDDDPWEIPIISSDDDSDRKKIIYVFTKLSRVGSGKKNIVRTAGGGTWHGNTGAKDIYTRGEPKRKIGSKKMFTFKARNGLNTKGHWTMHEYSLSEDIVNTDYVICKITKILSKGDPEIIPGGETELRNPQAQGWMIAEDASTTALSSMECLPREERPHNSDFDAFLKDMIDFSCLDDPLFHIPDL